ncbi:MAG: TatD DNase family protein [Candidatus Latescibacterota bacterium]|jgi:TatD DNase family protein
MLVDSHCHLDQFADVAAVLEEAAECGVERVVAVSEAPESMQAVLELKRRFPQHVFAGLGLHPAWVTEHDDLVEAALKWLAEHLAEADLLGEVGLDYKWALTDEEQTRQCEVLERQLALAAQHKKPINLHSRRALRQTMEKAIEFRRGSGLNAQLHWFTESKKLVRICNDEGIYVSVGPTVLKNEPTQQVVVEIADELLLLETDAPVSVGGESGHPRRLREVAECVAALRGGTWEDIAALSGTNFARFLGGPVLT